MSEHVLIGCLAGSMSVHASHTIIAFHLPIWTGDPNIPFRFSWAVEGATRPQELARNRLMQRALEVKADILLMVDHDMILDDGILKLLATPDYDICGPKQYMEVERPLSEGGNEYINCAFNFETFPAEDTKMYSVWPENSDESFRVDAVGSGVMAIRRRVIEDPRMLIEPGHDPGAWFRNVYHANGQRIRGLDLDFCFRAKHFDYRTICNWAVEVGHYRKTNINNMDSFMKRGFQMGIEAARKGESWQHQPTPR